MNRGEIRGAVRQLLRDEGYPTDALNDALNILLSEINNKHRFRFQQTFTDLALTPLFFDYQVPPGLIAEDLLVFQPGTTEQAIVVKSPTLVDVYSRTNFVETGPVPTYYTRYGDHFFFTPVPDSTVSGKVVRVFQYQDILPVHSDVSVPSIPARYHYSVLVQGVAARVRPTLITTDGQVVGQGAKEALEDMIVQELWNPLTSYTLQHSGRFNGMGRWGAVGTLRG